MVQLVLLVLRLGPTPVALRIGFANVAALCLAPALTVLGLATACAPRRHSRRRWFPVAFTLERNAGRDLAHCRQLAMTADVRVRAVVVSTLPPSSTQWSRPPMATTGRCWWYHLPLKLPPTDPRWVVCANGRVPWDVGRGVLLDGVHAS